MPTDVDWRQVRAELSQRADELCASGVDATALARAISHAARGEELPPPFAAPSDARDALFRIAYVLLVVAPAHYGLARATMPMRIDAIVVGEAAWPDVWRDLEGFESHLGRAEGAAAAEVSALMRDHLAKAGDPRALRGTALERALTDALLAIQARMSLGRALVSELAGLVADTSMASPVVQDDADGAAELRAMQQKLDAELEEDPTDARRWANRASARLARGDLAGAETDLDAALERSPEHALSRAKRAAVRLCSGRPAEAMHDLVEARRGALDEADLAALDGVREAALSQLRERLVDLELVGELDARLAEGDLDAAEALLQRLV